MLSLSQSSDLLHRAPKVFSAMFEHLLLGCFISQGELSRKATALRETLIKNGNIARGDSLIGSQAQQTISNVLDGQQRPTQGQLLLWLHVIRDWCNDSPDMLAKIERINVPKPRYPAEVEQDFYRLALFGSIDEIREAYEYWKDASLLVYLEETRTIQCQKSTAVALQDTDEIPSWIPPLSGRRDLDKEIIRRIREYESQH